MKDLRNVQFSVPPPAVPSLRTARAGVRTMTGVIGGLLLFVLLAGSVGEDTLGKQLLLQFHHVTRSLDAGIADTTSRRPSFESLPADPVLSNLPAHPTNRLSPYLAPGSPETGVANPSVLRKFHTLLRQFAQRQSEDDNFTVRVIDRRSEEILEVHTLANLRGKYQDGGWVPDWRDIDDRRREVTRVLVDKYEDKGIPLEDIMVRWGRSNQVQAAQERNKPYHAYEIQLARYLGLSLLPTQMGTVETFNQDSLVSPAGAKSRYQMMPWILRRSGVNEYTLSTEANSGVHVEEALHPLLTMEPAFLLLRGYVNAVGHEIPGMSAYHTGPGNIYKLYRRYFTQSKYYTPTSTVADAYIWAVTDGFDTIREETSFGPFSRGYIPSAYGALEARNQEPVDLSQTLHVARVQLRPGKAIALERLLTVLDSTGQTFDWGPAASHRTSYARFRALNHHIDLPPSPDASIPADGNVRLVSSVGGKSVRFFLPLGAPDALRAAGLDVLHPNLTFRFDGSTYAGPTAAETTVWDERYDDLVDDIAHFGFTPSNRKRLLTLHDKFVELAEERPTRYRQRQLKVIRTHRRIWLSNPWEELSDVAMQMTGRRKPPIRPPMEIPVAETDLQAPTLTPFSPPSSRRVGPNTGHEAVPSP